MSTAYDAVPYPGRPYRQTHPLRLGVHAALIGLPFAPAETCRVLEIGCGEGANLIPMALGYPDARFVGFDLAPSAIEKGRATAEALGLSNIRLEVQDILEAGPELGEFDYIIAHGVYAWVPAPVREALMRLVGACLAPHGVAFVSYNAMPGSHLRRMMRDMLIYHLARAGGTSGAPAEAAQSLLRRFIELAPSEEPVVAVLKAYGKTILARQPEVLFHDELGPVYDPVYLAEFVAHAGRHGLDFLSGADGTSWREELFPTPLGRNLAELSAGDAVALNQYVDFFTGRAFNETLLRRGDVAAQRAVEPARLRHLCAAAPAKPAVEETDPASTAEVKFELGPERAIQIGDPAIKAALRALGQAWPQAVPIAELPPGEDVEQALLQLFAAGHVQLQTGPWPFVSTPGERPAASPLARLQIAQGEEGVTSLDHGRVILEDELARFFLSKLDGRNDREALAQIMAGRVGIPVEKVRGTIDPHLVQLARLALLTG